MARKQNQSGFTVVEVLLVLILVAISAFSGYYVWHSQKQSNDSLNSAKKSSQTSAATSSTGSPSKPAGTHSSSKDLVISQWGVRIPNGTSETFTYKLSGPYADLSTQNLAAKDPLCSIEKGPAVGVIQRAAAGDAVYEDGTTAVEAYKASPNTIARIGSYYYVYTSPQAGCSNDSTVNDYQLSIIPEIRALVPLAVATNS